MKQTLSDHDSYKGSIILANDNDHYIRVLLRQLAALQLVRQIDTRWDCV